MSDVKQVKVDNWGIYFLQRLKHFFNRTDYCDLTLQFQDNAQLKVHRLVLSACTEYFELLERTCEMYEDCLVMPDDLQADVVVPIVNFMYTGHLEFRMDLLERLYQTSQILNMPVLSKLLESHRNLTPKTAPPAHSYSGVKKFTKQNHIEPKPIKSSTPAGPSHKRSYSKAFDNNIVYRDKKYQTVSKPETINNTSYRAPSPISIEPYTPKKSPLTYPRPTRYEVPEELDTDNIFDNSFCSISYTSQPLMVHPDTVKRYSGKRSGLFNEHSSSKKVSRMSTVDIVECKRITKEDNIFDDGIAEHNLNDETEMFNPTYMDSSKDPNQLFDQILDHTDGPKVTIETKDSKTASNLDHARIISEVLKKYPHLVKSNKSIKLKILDTPGKGKKTQKPPPSYVDEKPFKLKTEEDSDYIYETDVLDSKQAAKLIALGAENTRGPWICLICGTPGKALHFPSYYKFRRHLVEVHNEKPVSNICEYCGLRSLKRNYLLHHLYSQHGVQPPPQYHFPKCNYCSYIALTEGLLIKHKLSHKELKNFRCNVCSAAFASSSQLLTHIQNTGHKYSAEKKTNLQCIYCLKVFLRETNLYAHIKTHHKKEAKNDCIIEDSDEERIVEEKTRKKGSIKFEPSTSYDNEFEDVDLQYQIQQRPIGDVQVAARKQHNVMPNSKQKILNPGFETPKQASKNKPKTVKNIQPVHNEYLQDMKMPLPSNNQADEVVLIDNNEYIMRDNQLIPRKRKSGNNDYILADMMDTTSLQTIQQSTTSMEYTNVQNTNIEENIQQSSMIIKKTANINQPIQIVVSNEEEYKALMASNQPIIFDNGDANKTLTVLTAPHHNTTMEPSSIDLDNTQQNDMMIIPEAYPLNVTEAVATDNSNIVVVYSHPVDDQNKQFQILTTGGIGTQFVQSSAIITQNYETVTTSTPVMSAHILDTQVEQSWPTDSQSIASQQMQLAAETEIQNVVESAQVEIRPIHSETVNSLDDLPVVHLDPEPQKAVLPQLNENYNMPPSQSDVVNNELLDQPVEQEIVEEPQIMSETQIDNNLPSEKETHIVTSNDTVNINPQAERMLEVFTNNENSIIEETMEAENVAEQLTQAENVIEHSTQTENVIEHSIQNENVIEQIIETENVMEQTLETENVVEQSMDTETVIEQAMETENVMEQSMGTGNVIEQAMETENVIEQAMETENVIEQAMQTENIIEQTMETVGIIEQTSPLQQEVISEQEHAVDAVTITENLEGAENASLDTEEQQLEPMESQAYDDIVEANPVNDGEPTCAKEAEEQIQNLTSEWSEDEYDVVEKNASQIVEKVPDAVLQNQVIEAEEPELEESIENIQQEVNNQMAAANQMSQTGFSSVATTCAIAHVGETEENTVSSQEEDSSSQEMQLPPLTESPVHTIVPNPQAQQKISSLLNDWEDNDSQEEMITVTQNVEQTPVETNETKDSEDPQDSSTSLPVTADETVEVPKNDNIKSLVSDWDDDEEETKE